MSPALPPAEEMPGGTRCKRWHGALNKYGYGVLVIENQYTYAHRVAYEKRHGPLAKGAVLENLCGAKGGAGRRCINPDHWRLKETRRDYSNDPRKKVDSRQRLV